MKFLQLSNTKYSTHISNCTLSVPILAYASHVILYRSHHSHAGTAFVPCDLDL